MTLVQLDQSHREDAFRFCRERVHASTFIAGWIENDGLNGSRMEECLGGQDVREGRKDAMDGWLFGELDGQVAGLVYISRTGIVLPLGISPEAIADLVQMALRNRSAFRVLLGERQMIVALTGLLEEAVGLRPRLVRDQIGCLIERGELRDESEDLELTTADLSHLEQLVGASAAMAREEMGDDPHSRNPKLFRTRVRERIERGRDFVHQVDGKIVFKANVSVVSPISAQIEGIYTVPAWRRRGIGRRGTATLTRWVLARSLRAFLLVNDDNEPARKLYSDLGYRRVLSSRTVFIM